MRSIRLATLVLLAAVGPAGQAAAATATYIERCYRGLCSRTLIKFRAADGERNRLTVSSFEDGIEVQEGV
jgi:hypothetical protein